MVDQLEEKNPKMFRMEKKKVKPPFVRHTKTSMARLLRANPLIELGWDVNNPDIVWNLNKIQSHLPLQEKVKSSQDTAGKDMRDGPEKASSTTASHRKGPKIFPSKTEKQLKDDIKVMKNMSKVLIKKPKPIVKTFNRSMKKPDTNALKTVNKQVKENVVQEENLLVRELGSDISPIHTKANRCTNLYTPGITGKGSYSFRASTPAPRNLQKLQDRLTAWLKSRGKPTASYHHLRYFQPAEVVFEYEKENVEAPANLDQPAIDSLQNELLKHVKDALLELLTLIEDDYSVDQCQEWLELIRQKYEKIDDEPVYWECRAALEAKFGNIHNAMEYCKKGLKQGSTDSLAHLLRKLSELHIIEEDEFQPKDAISKREEMKQVFNSSIIQFAVRDTNIRKPTSQESLLITPVRRSTRVSRSNFTYSGAIKLHRSLKEVDLTSPVITFQKNKYLL